MLAWPGAASQCPKRDYCTKGRNHTGWCAPQCLKKTTCIRPNRHTGPCSNPVTMVAREAKLRARDDPVALCCKLRVCRKVGPGGRHMGWCFPRE